MKALALFSGGLDSVLAMKLIVDQGIEVVAVNINIGFGSANDRLEHMQNMCKQIGVQLEVLDLRELYLDEVLFDPKYGYGKNFNPCIDCHGFMFRYTGELLEKFGASFMISGEVIGQRPMSQRKDAMEQVKKLSNYDELIVRPLSAKLMTASKPELEGWIDREKLLDINGRSRERQLQIAKDIGLTDFESPGGGCLLTEIQFGNKLKDFVEYDKDMKVEDIDTLKAGRHLRLPNGAKVIIGRSQEDNEKLKLTNSKRYYKVRILDATGPLALMQKEASSEDNLLAAQLIVTYGKTQMETQYEVKFFDENDSTNDIVITATKFPNKDIAAKYLI
ncbi:MAG: 7-cyano-7-deazaguanine synthase [Campylobacterota bacterium]|nr:7-cyano-7-deazaguanine synthase [Campylobacterota bacterium]